MGSVARNGKLGPRGGENTNAAATCVVDVARASERVQLSVVWQRAMWLKFPRRVLKVLGDEFAHERRLTYEKRLAASVHTATAIRLG